MSSSGKQLKNKRSQKHHFLPRYYLRGFVNNSEDCLFIYDKQNDKILPKALSIGAVFFENNLNTAYFPKGESSDFLEDAYTIIENKSWCSLDNIRSSNSKMSIELLDKMHLFSFLSFLHWRLPSNIKHVEELSKTFFDEDNKKLNYFTLEYKSGESVSKEIIDTIKSSSVFKKSSKLLLPFAPFYDSGWSEKLNNWRFLYTRNRSNGYLVGDNPIITAGINDHDPMNCLNEFVFPVSGNVLLVNACKPVDRDLSSEFAIQFNIAIIERAHRFVACQNKGFLEVLIKRYKVYERFKKTDLIISEMFDALK